MPTVPGWPNGNPPWKALLSFFFRAQHQRVSPKCGSLPTISPPPMSRWVPGGSKFCFPSPADQHNLDILPDTNHMCCFLCFGTLSQLVAYASVVVLLWFCGTDNGMGPAGGWAISKVLKANSTLQEIDLSGVLPPAMSCLMFKRLAIFLGSCIWAAALFKFSMCSPAVPSMWNALQIPTSGQRDHEFQNAHKYALL